MRQRLKVNLLRFRRQCCYMTNICYSLILTLCPSWVHCDQTKHPAAISEARLGAAKSRPTQSNKCVSAFVNRARTSYVFYIYNPAFNNACLRNVQFSHCQIICPVTTHISTPFGVTSTPHKQTSNYFVQVS